MDVRYLILLLFFAVSCMPAPSSVSKGNLANSGTTTSGTNGGSASSQSTLKWNYLNDNTTSITINVSNYNNAYLIGNPVESYLAGIPNFINEDFCLVGSYLIGGFSHELRSRAIPISYYDFVAKRTVRIIRVDFPDVTNSKSTCEKTVRIPDGSDNFVIDNTTPPALRIKYDPFKVCEDCTSTLIANNVRLFILNSSLDTLDQVPLSKINTGIISMQIDPNFSNSGSSGVCSNSDCRARGFDCCLDNQCANDGAIRPAARTTYASLLDNAEAERLQNPLAYLNYPQLYYICGTSIPTDPTSGASGGSTGGSFEPGLEQLKKDYACIENLKSQSTVTPFHNEVLTKTYTASANCLTTGDTTATQFYKNVLKRLYTTCGCDRTDLDEMVTNCPNYEYTIIARDSNNQPLAFNCYTPPTNPTIPTRQTVAFSGRTAPHRFFDMNGLESDPSKGVEQEGLKFEYIDEGKILPVQQPSSINAVLGQMAVTLDQALPAKSVNVELDQVYVISTTSGFYTPCPTCSKDSWLSTFTAFPTTAYGSGLQATGHTTERDIFGTNTTAGNYEDTIFGRACWVPPTMIPFTHTAVSTSVQDQRETRLTAQAALFVNGYQRDWYGFNKGAVIGSFDGVKWFAIGKGRIVRSTSKKLFIAINAPFADVAAPTLQVVNVSTYDGITQAPSLDYDPQYDQYHPLQNEAGNCQKYHQCSVDSDCIAKLGWEYACADVQSLTTNLPEFDVDAKERLNVATNVPIQDILQQKTLGSSSSKRCVYRGAGSICHRASQTFLSTDPNKTKLLTCAPNFHCAPIAGSGHNTRISRFAALLEEIPASRNHFFGKDANVLGRPLDYIGTGLFSSIGRTSIVDNMDSYEASMLTNTGICQPGKALPTTPASEAILWNPYAQHQSPDSLRRTDFISQIGSCNSGLFTNNRHSSCPVLEADGNYRMFGTTISQLAYRAQATTQNSCGLESLRSDASLAATADTLLPFSPFRNIEARPLNSQIILDPTLARDACFRRAGSVCHTDLDCSPNKLHANQVDNFPSNFFGNIAERNYWSESLVCGQRDPKPLPSDTLNFASFDLTKNTCCREVGKDLTTFTNYVPTNAQGTAYLNYGFAGSTIPALASTIAPGVNPNALNRYSRFATVDDINNPAQRVPLTAYQDRIFPGSNVLNSISLQNVMTDKQWPTLNEANQESCCGGGWIRKFSDGTTDWTRRDRVVLDVNNFRCLNSRNALLTNPQDIPLAQYPGTPTVTQLVSQDFVNYCIDPSGTLGSCAQYSFLTEGTIGPQTDNYGFMTINTIDAKYRTPVAQLDYYFKPKSGDSDAAVTLDYNNTASTARKNLQIKLPSYVPRDFDQRFAIAALGTQVLPASAMGLASMQVRMVTDDGSGVRVCRKSTWDPTTPTQEYGADACEPGLGLGCCYYNFNPTTRVLKVGANDTAKGTIFDRKKVGIEITGIRVGGAVNRSRPGTTLFYLKNFGQLELSGIPQISHPALFCNDNSDRVVDGIFNPTIKTKTQFQAGTFSWSSSASGVSQFYTNMHGLQLDPVFSANDFKCCSPLGKTVKNASLCCSGFAVREDAADPSSPATCMLPPGTDLMVYFNRFVSNEGKGTEQPGGGLVDADFNERTGEPVINSSVIDKIRELGAAYCSSGETRQGGAFGSFEPEPQGPTTDLSQRIYGIVDSPNDVGQSSNAGSTEPDGYESFMNGFRWNHHLYCTDGQ